MNLSPEGDSLGGSADLAQRQPRGQSGKVPMKRALAGSLGKVRIFCLACALIATAATNVLGGAMPTGPAEAPAERESRMKWWREARFGLFIHWGLYAVPAGSYQGREVPHLGEWIMNDAPIPFDQYKKFASQFDPTRFDAEQWADLAAAAGIKYVVITSKHHDGFSLWDSRTSDYDIMDSTPFRRDILKELADALKKRGIVFCLYYSIMDWHHPDAQGKRFPLYRDHFLKPQLRELLTGYGPIGVLWFDGEWIPEWTDEQGKELQAYLRSLQPQLIVNNRIGKGRRGKDGMDEGPGSPGDFGTPEQTVPAAGLPGVDWEACQTMNDTWGFKASDSNWKPAEKLLKELVDVASKGGNYLLNVGPTAAGEIPEASVARLRQIGAWLKVNGEAIYGSSAGRYPAPAWGRYTSKEGRLFAHVFQWPAGGSLKVEAKDLTPARAYLLSDPDRKELGITPSADGFQIAVPRKAPDPLVSVVVIEYK